MGNDKFSKCPLCDRQDITFKRYPESIGTKYHIKCATCGNFKIDYLVPLMFLPDDREYGDKRYILSGLARLHHELNKTLEINKDNYVSLIENTNPPESLKDKMKSILKYVYSKSERFGNTIEVDYRNDYPISFSRNYHEFKNLIIELIKTGSLEGTPATGIAIVGLSSTEWQKIEASSLSSASILSKLADFPVFNTGDKELNRLIQVSIKKFQKGDIDIKKEAVEILWKAFERLKTLEEGKDKKEQTGALLNKAISQIEFREYINTEMVELTRIGNDFTIRHSETDKTIIDNPEYLDYLFYRLFVLIRMLIRLSERSN